MIQYVYKQESINKEDVMEVSKYLFQSPSSSQVQVGRLDPSSKQEQTKQEPVKESASSLPNETLKEAQSFQATQTKEVSPTVSNTLDLYA